MVDSLDPVVNYLYLINKELGNGKLTKEDIKKQVKKRLKDIDP